MRLLDDAFHLQGWEFVNARLIVDLNDYFQSNIKFKMFPFWWKNKKECSVMRHQSSPTVVKQIQFYPSEIWGKWGEWLEASVPNLRILIPCPSWFRHAKNTQASRNSRPKACHTEEADQSVECHQQSLLNTLDQMKTHFKLWNSSIILTRKLTKEQVNQHHGYSH